AMLAANNGFDGGNPLLHFRIPATGKYHLRITDRADAGSKDHFYRVSIGAFPVVVAHFPLGVPANKETDVELIGFNLPPGSRTQIKAGAAGEIVLEPKFHARREFKVVVNENPELLETEPNDAIANATAISVGSAID